MVIILEIKFRASRIAFREDLIKNENFPLELLNQIWSTRDSHQCCAL